VKTTKAHNAELTGAYESGNNTVVITRALPEEEIIKLFAKKLLSTGLCQSCRKDVIQIAGLTEEDLK